VAATNKLLICPVFLCLSNSIGVVHQFDWHGTTSVILSSGLNVFMFSGWLYAFGIIDFRNDPQMQSTAPTAEPVVTLLTHVAKCRALAKTSWHPGDCPEGSRSVVIHH
jgi:hypothetical protein